MAKTKPSTVMVLKLGIEPIASLLYPFLFRRIILRTGLGKIQFGDNYKVTDKNLIQSNLNPTLKTEREISTQTY